MNTEQITREEIETLVHEALSDCEFTLQEKDWDGVREIAKDEINLVKGQFSENRISEIAGKAISNGHFPAARVRSEVTAILATQQNNLDTAKLTKLIAEALTTATGRAVCEGVKEGNDAILPPVQTVDKFYVSNTPAGTRLARAIRQKRPVMVSGPSGSGKTFPIEQELRLAKRRYLKVSVADGLTFSDFVAKQDIKATKNGTVTFWRYGFLPFAMMNGLSLILDEIDQCQPELLSVLNAALEYNEIYIPQTGERITAKEGFQVFMTCNTLRDTTGTYSGFRLSAALLNRVVFVKADYLTPDQECNILKAVGATPPLALTVVESFTKLRLAYLQGRITQAPSTRLAVRITRCVLGLDDNGNQVDDKMSLQEAMDYCLFDGMPANELVEALKAITQK
jgi:MoxR-like ATPase